MKKRILFSVLILAITLFSQAATNVLLLNGDFKEAWKKDNLWDGIDSNNFIRVGVSGQRIILDGSHEQNVNFGASPCWKDVTGDRKADLVVGDGKGYLWVFETISKPKTFPPKFKHGRFIPTYFGSAMNIDVADYNADGKNDVLVGTPEGAIQIVRNEGKGMFVPEKDAPTYSSINTAGLRTRKAINLEKSFPLVMQGTKPLCIGSYVAPRLVDWTGDRKNDLIIGEGSYSANSIYLIKNAGNNANPDFNSSKKEWLGYGMGREHLSPAVGDLDGDGDLDLLVSDRSGKLTWYENIPHGRKFFTKPITNDFLIANTKIPCGEMVRPYLADIDGDKLLDLFLGCNDGRIFVCKNSGSRKKPSFKRIFPLVGIDKETPYLMPLHWWCAPDGASSGAKITSEKETDDFGKETNFIHLSFEKGYVGDDAKIGYGPAIKVFYNQKYHISFRARSKDLEVKCKIEQRLEDEVVGDTIVAKGGGGDAFAVKANRQWQNYSHSFSLDRLSKANKSNQFTYVNINFTTDKAESDSFLDISDIEVVKVK